MTEIATEIATGAVTVVTLDDLCPDDGTAAVWLAKGIGKASGATDADKIAADAMRGAVRLSRSGKSVTEIGQIVGVGRSTAHRWTLAQYLPDAALLGPADGARFIPTALAKIGSWNKDLTAETALAEITAQGEARSLGEIAIGLAARADGKAGSIFKSLILEDGIVRNRTAEDGKIGEPHAAPALPEDHKHAAKIAIEAPVKIATSEPAADPVTIYAQTIGKIASDLRQIADAAPDGSGIPRHTDEILADLVEMVTVLSGETFDGTKIEQRRKAILRALGIGRPAPTVAPTA